MLPRDLLKKTSTPFTVSHEIIEETSDSGYHSNTSGHNTSVDSSIPACQSRSFITQTPNTTDSLFDNVSSIELSESKKDRGKIFESFRWKYRQTILIEKKYVDFLYHLGEKSNNTVILRRILDYLNDEDLYNAVAVSKSWENIILSIPVYRKRFRLYVKKVDSTKENRMVQNEYDPCEDRKCFSSRVTLTEIQNISKPLASLDSPRSSASPPIVYRNHRFEAYQTEARRLKLGKRLFSCPKCKLPSHIDENEPNAAVCTNSSCRYRFCILCHCEEHPSKICHFISTPVVRKQSTLVGTQTSKKNLKRLLL